VTGFVYRRVLARVATVEGGVERLGRLLGVSSTLVTRWIDGQVPVPICIFLKCVDYLQDQYPYYINSGRLPPQSMNRVVADRQPGPVSRP
jgi:hypothetical protein